MWSVLGSCSTKDSPSTSELYLKENFTQSSHLSDTHRGAGVFQLVSQLPLALLPGDHVAACVATVTAASTACGGLTSGADGAAAGPHQARDLVLAGAVLIVVKVSVPVVLLEAVGPSVLLIKTL